MRSLNHFQSRANFNAGRKKAWWDVFSKLYLSRQYFRNFQNIYLLTLIKITDRTKHKGTSINSFNTNLLSLITIRSKLKCMRMIINRLIKHFFKFHISEKRTVFNVALIHWIALPHISWILYLSEMYLITNYNFWTACLYIFLYLRWLGRNFSVCESVIIALMLVFEDLQLCSLYAISKTLYQLKKIQTKLVWLKKN